MNDPLLFSEMDLTKLGHGTDLYQILYFAQRLSRLSRNSLKKVSLDLTSFKQEQEKYYTKGRLGKFSSLDALLETLHPSRGTLQEVSFIIKGGTTDDSSFFFVDLLKRLHEFKSLVRIAIIAPSIISIKARGLHDGRLKRFTLSSNEANVTMNDGNEPEESILFMLHQVKKLMGENCELIKFEIDTNSDVTLESIPTQLLDEVSLYHSSLRCLIMGPIGDHTAQDLWDFSQQFKGLNTLFLHLDAPPVFAVGEITLRVPNHGSMDGIRRLGLVMNGPVGSRFTVPWNSFSKCQLESLHVASEEYGFVESCLPSPDFLSSKLILNSISKLKSLVLKGIDLQYSEFIDLGYKKPFPTLAELNLVHMSVSTYRFFSEVSCPNLTNLSVIDNDDESPVKVNYILMLVEANSSNLKELTLSHQASEGDDYEHFSSFSFPKLQKMSIWSVAAPNMNFQSWLSRFSYPNLVELRGVRDAVIREQFQLNSPKLVKFAQH